MLHKVLWHPMTHHLRIWCMLTLEFSTLNKFVSIVCIQSHGSVLQNDLDFNPGSLHGYSVFWDVLEEWLLLSRAGIFKVCYRKQAEFSVQLRGNWGWTLSTPSFVKSQPILLDLGHVFILFLIYAWYVLYKC